MTIPCRRIRIERSLSRRHCGRRLLLLLCQSGRHKDQEYAGNNGCSHSGLLDQKWDEHYRREHYRRVAHSSPVLARVGFPPTTFAAPPTRGPRRARFWPAGVEARGPRRARFWPAGVEARGGSSIPSVAESATPATRRISLCTAAQSTRSPSPTSTSCTPVFPAPVSTDPPPAAGLPRATVPDG